MLSYLCCVHFLLAVVMDRLIDEFRQETPWTVMFTSVICSESREQVEMCTGEKSRNMPEGDRCNTEDARSRGSEGK